MDVDLQQPIEARPTQQRSSQLWLPLVALLIVVAVYVYEVKVAGAGWRYTLLTADGGPSDFYPRWAGARQLLDQRLSPYSAYASDLLERGYAGFPHEALHSVHANSFAYPIYVVFVLFPFFYLPLDLAAWTWSLLGLLLAASSIYLWCRLIKWPATTDARLAIAILTLGFVGVTNTFFLQQISSLLPLWIALLYWALRWGYGFLAGSILALFLVKPQVAILLIPALLLWAAFGWRNRNQRRLLLGFVATLGVMELGAEIILPGWIGDFISALHIYTDANGNDSLLTTLIPQPLLAIPLSVLLLCLTAFFCWQARAAAPADYSFLYAFCFVLVITALVTPSYALYNQPALVLPAALFCLAQVARYWRSRYRRVTIELLIGCLVWNFLASIGFDLLYFTSLGYGFLRDYRFLPEATALLAPAATLAALLVVAPSSPLTFLRRRTAPGELLLAPTDVGGLCKNVNCTRFVTLDVVI